MTPAASRSVADCARCCAIPQQVDRDDPQIREEIAFPELDGLVTVVEARDEGSSSADSTTRLLQCPDCGTCYLFTHYREEGERWDDPKCHQASLRRYTPLAAIGFLERLAGDPRDALPRPLGQMVKAFVEGSGPPATRVAQAGRDALVAKATRAVAGLRAGYDAVLDDLSRVLRMGAPNGHIQRYAVEARFDESVRRQDWEGLRRELLGHGDPVVRVTAAGLVIGIGTGDAPVTDLVHVGAGVREFLAAQVRKASRRGELFDVLLEVAGGERRAFLRFDHGYGTSRYVEWDVRDIALYYLRVLGGKGAALAARLGDLEDILRREPLLIRSVCEVLRTLAGQPKNDLTPVVPTLIVLLRKRHRAYEEVAKALEEVAARRGYDLVPALPVVAGLFTKGPDARKGAGWLLKYLAEERGLGPAILAEFDRRGMREKPRFVSDPYFQMVLKACGVAS
ncbi:MAG: hypothetical protein GX442_13845 [Candidatus Riflebacteria bacterium]|nr:hypothetical protein [Candidatus Riflebacteria bacterium]